MSIEKTDPPTISDIMLLLQDIAKDVRTLVESHAQLRKTVYGNGEPGLDEQVRELRKQLDRHNKIVWMLGSIMGALVLGFLWAIFIGEYIIIKSP